MEPRHDIRKEATGRTSETEPSHHDYRRVDLNPD